MRIVSKVISIITRCLLCKRVLLCVQCAQLVLNHRQDNSQAISCLRQGTSAKHILYSTNRSSIFRIPMKLIFPGALDNLSCLMKVQSFHTQMTDRMILEICIIENTCLLLKCETPICSIRIVFYLIFLRIMKRKHSTGQTDDYAKAKVFRIGLECKMYP